MDRIPESLQGYLISWLLEDSAFSPKFSEQPLPSQEAQTGRAPDSRPDISNPKELLELSDLDPLDSEEISFMLPDYGELGHDRPKWEQTFKMGDTPVMQDRFYTLLKRRLQTEIQSHPPLFPWETEISDYESDGVDSPFLSAAELEPDAIAAIEHPEAVWIWTEQLRNLHLPVPVPEAILAQLLSQCQQVVNSSLREGAKLVRAVEALFPNESQALNQLAGMVMMSPSRSGSMAELKALEMPASYEAATPTQQMALALLAARELIGTLTLTLSRTQPVVERQWLTALGPLTLKLEYQESTAQLRTEVQLPGAGSLQLHTGQAKTLTQRSDAGCLRAELPWELSNVSSVLAIQLAEPDQQPLMFTVRFVSDAEASN